MDEIYGISVFWLSYVICRELVHSKSVAASAYVGVRCAFQ